jgi:hypothetical protein
MVKKRGRVEVSPGSILPTNRKPWERAEEKLNEASGALARMRIAGNRATYERAWEDFVDALQEAWVSIIRDGEKISSKFQPWAGKIKSEITRDPLLYYLRNARNKSQHDPIPLKWTRGSISFRPKKDLVAHIRDLRVYSDGSLDYESPEGDPEFIFKSDFGKPSLPPITMTEPKPVVVQPPQEHLGKQLGNVTPDIVAELGVTFYRDALDKAKQKFLNEI